MKISYFTKNSTIPMAIDYESNIYFNKIDEVGYYSIMFVYDSSLPDYLVFCARHLNRNHKFKFLIAMRAYAISPEYCSMISHSFGLMQKDRLSFNILSGDFQPHENVLKNIVLISEQLDTSQKRIRYTQQWLKKFFIIFKDQWYKPEIVISGISELTTANAKIYGDKQLVMLSSYREKMFDRIECAGKMVSVAIYIGDSLSREDILEKYCGNEMMMNSTIFGTEEEVIEEIINLEGIGITDVLLFPMDINQESLVHDMSKKLISKINAKDPNANI